MTTPLKEKLPSRNNHASGTLCSTVTAPTLTIVKTFSCSCVLVINLSILFTNCTNNWLTTVDRTINPKGVECGIQHGIRKGHNVM